LREAYLSIRRQTWRGVEIILILNGADAGVTRLAYELVRDEPRARVLELPTPNLAAALNAGMKSAKFDLVARMDADDTCSPSRLEMQVAFLERSPEVAALGTNWELVDTIGTVHTIDPPPPAPERVRWKLLLGNFFCHGSMLLRRGPIFSLGGYDESLRYAQDYDLWLRLNSAGAVMANLPEVLYRYSAATGRRHHEQAAAACAAMIRAWSSLAPASSRVWESISRPLARGTWGGAEARWALAELEAVLDREGPSREGLLAWQWIDRRAQGPDLERRMRLWPAAERLARAGVSSAWLYGAGKHTAWLVQNIDQLGIRVLGIVDDSLAGSERFGHAVLSPEEIPDGAHVVISSDAYESEMWEASLPMRARGITVHRIYDAEASVPV
jgi:hypothetical protein